MSLELAQDHLVPCTPQESTVLRSSTSTNSNKWAVFVPTFSVPTRPCLRYRLSDKLAAKRRPCSHSSRPRRALRVRVCFRGRALTVTRNMVHEKPCDTLGVRGPACRKGLSSAPSVGFNAVHKGEHSYVTPRGGTKITTTIAVLIVQFVLYTAVTILPRDGSNS